MPSIVSLLPEQSLGFHQGINWFVRLRWCDRSQALSSMEQTQEVPGTTREFFISLPWFEPAERGVTIAKQISTCTKPKQLLNYRERDRRRRLAVTRCRWQPPGSLTFRIHSCASYFMPISKYIYIYFIYIYEGKGCSKTYFPIVS